MNTRILALVTLTCGIPHGYNLCADKYLKGSRDEGKGSFLRGASSYCNSRPAMRAIATSAVAVVTVELDAVILREYFSDMFIKMGNLIHSRTRLAMPKPLSHEDDSLLSARPSSFCCFEGNINTIRPKLTKPAHISLLIKEKELDIAFEKHLSDSRSSLAETWKWMATTYLPKHIASNTKRNESQAGELWRNALSQDHS